MHSILGSAFHLWNYLWTEEPCFARNNSKAPLAPGRSDSRKSKSQFFGVFFSLFKLVEQRGYISLVVTTWLWGQQLSQWKFFESCVLICASFWVYSTARQGAWGEQSHCPNKIYLNAFTLWGCHVSGICGVNMCRRRGAFNFTVLFFQLIADLLAHYLLSADDSCEGIQACVLGWKQTREKRD